MGILHHEPAFRVGRSNKNRPSGTASYSEINGVRSLADHAFPDFWTTDASVSVRLAERVAATREERLMRRRLRMSARHELDICRWL
jgi:hypothetical protein